jgi:hypothetical protein
VAAVQDENIGNTAGFVSHHNPVPYFLMHTELSQAYNMEGGGLEMDGCLWCLQRCQKITYRREVPHVGEENESIFMRAITTLEKHFH